MFTSVLNCTKISEMAHLVCVLILVRRIKNIANNHPNVAILDSLSRTLAHTNALLYYIYTILSLLKDISDKNVMIFRNFIEVK